MKQKRRGHSNPKAKGSAFERDVCRRLSLWVTDGKREDTFWRSAMSGGRATVRRKAGVDVRQAGDICAVAPEGHALTDKHYIECKHVKRAGFEQFFIKRTGPLREYWTKAVQEANHYKRNPMLIIKQNGSPTLVISRPGIVSQWTTPIILVRRRVWSVDVTLLNDLLETKFVS